MAYTDRERDKTFDAIIQDIENGLSLRASLRIGDKASSRTFYKWLDEDEAKVKQYTRATTERAEQIFEDILEIADDQEDDVYKDADGNEQTNHNVINRAKIRIDSRKWMLGKMNPKKYSDKIQVYTTEFSEQQLFPDVPKNDSNK